MQENPHEKTFHDCGLKMRKSKGSDMGMPLPEMQENPKSSTCCSFGLKFQENPKVWPGFSLLS